MRQAAAAANQAERLQRVAEEKALLEIEYVRKEGDACLAALNACWEPGTQGTQDRARNDDDDDRETAPPEISAHRDMFSGLPEEEIVKIFRNKFKPIVMVDSRQPNTSVITTKPDQLIYRYDSGWRYDSGGEETQAGNKLITGWPSLIAARLH